MSPRMGKNSNFLGVMETTLHWSRVEFIITCNSAMLLCTIPEWDDERIMNMCCEPSPLAGIMQIVQSDAMELLWNTGEDCCTIASSPVGSTLTTLLWVTMCQGWRRVR